MQLSHIQQLSSVEGGEEIISIECVGETEGEYVYDLETEDGTFQAGYGDIILKNTDSIYTIFNGYDMSPEHIKESMKKIFEVSIEAAKMISDTFPDPMELEFEKVMFPFILASKKRYAALIWTNPDKPDYVDIKGLQSVRRDNCPFVRDTCKECFNELLYNRDIEGASKVARDAIVNLLDGRIDISKLTKTKSLRDSYNITKISEEVGAIQLYRKNNWSEKLKCGIKLKGEKVVERYKNKGNKIAHKIYASVPAMPHLHLAIKMYDRDPMNAPKPGERVPFVYIKGGGLQCERVEHPKEVAVKDIDNLHYYNNELKNPLINIFEHVVEDVESVIYFPDAQTKIKLLERQFKEHERKLKNKNNNQAEITRWFSAKGT